MTTTQQSGKQKDPRQERQEHQERVQRLYDRARGLMPVDDKTAWNLCDLCTRYGLDPISGDVAFLQGGVPYVTFRGMIRVAHASGQFNGTTVEVVHSNHEKGEYLVKARVYKKGCEHPFEDIGDSETKNKQVGKMGKIKIATTRAKCRALRSAFPIVLPVEGDSADEMADQLAKVKAGPMQDTEQRPQQGEQEQRQVNHQEAARRDDNGARQGEATERTAPKAKADQSTANPPNQNDGSNSEAWKAAKKRLGQTMKDLNLSGRYVSKVSMETHGKSASSELNARELNSLIIVLREENQGDMANQGRPTGPIPPADRR